MELMDDPFGSSGIEKHPNLSLSEDEQKVYVEAHIPGIEADAVEITLENHILWIKGEKISKEEDEKRKYHCQSQSSFSYKITLPETVDGAVDPHTSLEKGVLSMVFDKTKKDQPKRIRIGK
ncbi:MAG: hypothetical protein S4CHLAM102_15660 [Chlamydiia bacterium]|nr:hypothetical protein [Chlamydiia bacterium]